MSKRVFSLLAAALMGSAACRPASEPQKSAVLGVQDPAAIKAQLALFAPLPERIDLPGDPVTPAKVDLGRRLFHEPVLSSGHDVSCNTCHSLNGYGADGRPTSFGDLGKPGGRNAPTVYNAAGHVAQFWDGRAATVEEQAKGPILNPAEMAMPHPQAVLEHMRTSAVYRAAFRAAFPGEKDPITYDNVGRAIGAFERGLVTPAPWDRYLKGDRTALTPAQEQGFAVFAATGCASCHNGAYVGGNSYRKLGQVQPWANTADSGRVRVTKQAADLMVFKVPSLRNVAMTGPCFHDGSVATLPEAVRLMARHQLGKELSDEQVGAIVTWLGSLTGTLPAEYIALPQLSASGR